MLEWHDLSCRTIQGFDSLYVAQPKSVWVKDGKIWRRRVMVARDQMEYGVIYTPSSRRLQNVRQTQSQGHDHCNPWQRRSVVLEHHAAAFGADYCISIPSDAWHSTNRYKDGSLSLLPKISDFEVVELILCLQQGQVLKMQGPWWNLTSAVAKMKQDVWRSTCTSVSWIVRADISPQLIQGGFGWWHTPDFDLKEVTSSGRLVLGPSRFESSCWIYNCYQYDHIAKLHRFVGFRFFHSVPYAYQNGCGYVWVTKLGWEPTSMSWVIVIGSLVCFWFATHFGPSNWKQRLTWAKQPTKCSSHLGMIQTMQKYLGMTQKMQ